MIEKKTEIMFYVVIILTAIIIGFEEYSKRKHREEMASKGYCEKFMGRWSPCEEKSND